MRAWCAAAWRATTQWSPLVLFAVICFSTHVVDAQAACPQGQYKNLTGPKMCTDTFYLSTADSNWVGPYLTQLRSDSKYTEIIFVISISSWPNGSSKEFSSNWFLGRSPFAYTAVLCTNILQVYMDNQTNSSPEMACMRYEYDHVCPVRAIKEIARQSIT